MSILASNSGEFSDMDLPWAEPFTLLIGEIEFFLNSMELDSMPEPSLDAKLELEKIQYFEKRAHGLLDLGDDNFQRRVMDTVAWLERIWNMQHLLEVVQHNDTNPHLSLSKLQVLDASIHSLIRSTHIQKKYERNPRRRPVRAQFELSKENVYLWTNMGNPISVGDITADPNPSWLDLEYWDEPMNLPEMDEKEKGGFYMAWPGYTRDAGKQFSLGKNLTRKGFLVKIANLVRDFCSERMLEICEDARWKIEAGNLELDGIYLFGVRRVSSAGFEPILLVLKRN